MTTFRLPENCLSLFKDLSNSTIDNLYGLTPKLRGAKLYNAFSRPLGHKDFNALQADSKTYGLGEFNPHELVDALKSKTSGVHVHLGYEWDQTVKALDIACSLILIDYPELSSLDDHKPLRVSLLAEELGITDEELELLSWEPTANMSEDGLIYNYIITFVEDCPQEILSKIRGINAYREVSVSANAFDEPDYDEHEVKQIGEAEFFQKVAGERMTIAEAKNQVETFIDEGAYLEAESQLDIYIAESGLLFEEAPVITDYSYFMGADLMYLTLKGTMAGSVDPDSDRMRTHHSVTPRIELHVHVEVPEDNSEDLHLYWGAPF